MTPDQFFFDFFKKSYCCAMMEGGGQFEGRIINDINELEEALRTYQELNRSGYNVFFTPNGALTSEGRNSLSNINTINSWYIDIDIEETKRCDDEETAILRKNKKDVIVGEILMSDLMPSLTIETRNGFQLYWLADSTATKERWGSIALSIFEKFKSLGADKSTCKIMQLMRVPNFYFFKKNEKGKIIIWESLSTFEKYSETTMIQYFHPITTTVTISTAPPLIDIVSVTKKYKKVIMDDQDDIFIKITKIPLDILLMKLSGHWLVDGDYITFQKKDVDKTNLIVNGHVSPNFIIRSKNQIFSNNATIKGPTIIQYIQWYKHSNARIAQGLKELVNNF